MKAIYLYPSKRPHHVLSENVIICRGLSNSSRDIEEQNIKKKVQTPEKFDEFHQFQTLRSSKPEVIA